MVYDLNDTIAAIGTAAGGAARGMVRLSGPRTLDCLARCFSCNDDSLELNNVQLPVVVQGTLHCEASVVNVPCDLFLWPTNRSYTRQPTAELHTFGSPPLLDAVLIAVCAHGARVAEPGEFTLRAFLAGRMDLTQAEAVLGVIDARDQPSLDTALSQLAGGLSEPLAELRESLLQILAELEAGLDFVEEDIEFISSDVLRGRLIAAQQTIATTIEQMASRADTLDMPRVALVGSPNVGKSSLFNALVAADELVPQAIVSSQSGTTRDYVNAVLQLHGISCTLIDTAGQETPLEDKSIERAAQEIASEQSQQANLRLYCFDNFAADLIVKLTDSEPDDSYLLVHTKSDLVADSARHENIISCSSVTGTGLQTLRSKIRERLLEAIPAGKEAVATTSARCTESLRLADEGLTRSLKLLDQAGGDELIAAEIRDALAEIGRVVGAVYTDDILDRVFSQFCIGK